MKIDFKYISIATALVALMSSCTGKFEEINTNPCEATQEQIGADGYIVSGALKSMQGYVCSAEEHEFQFFNIMTGGDLGGYLACQHMGWNAQIVQYNPNDGWTNGAFNTQLPNTFVAHKQLKNSTTDPVILAVADVIAVNVYSQITNIYGPIPYSKMGADGSLTAPYDSQEEIYHQMFATLTEAIKTLSEHSTSVFNANSDMVYGGKVSSWIKYANTLKLRLAMKVVYADPALAQQMAEEAVSNSFGTLESNADNATFVHPQRNNYYLACVEWNGGDHSPAADIICYMNGYNDPRRPAYFTEQTLTADGGYIGLRRGLVTNGNATGRESQYNIKTSDPMVWMVSSEAQFLKAEGALRGWNMGGSAGEFYRKGVALSFDQWGVGGVDAYLCSDSQPEAFTDYRGLGLNAPKPSAITPKWSDTDPFETSLERIIVQKWIANWSTTDYEGWDDIRRTGYPKLFPTANNHSSGLIPDDGVAHRLPYPTNEKITNSENYAAAVALLNGNGDNMASRFWWDCNPNVK